MPSFLFSKKFISLSLLFSLFFQQLFLPFYAYAQLANPPGAVGPELAVPIAGDTVVKAQGYTGTVAVINYVNQGYTTAENTVPTKNLNNPVILRVDFHANTPDADIVAWAQSLNANYSTEFPNGIKLIVAYVEANNLDWWYDVDLYPDNSDAAIAAAATEYTNKFKLLAQTLNVPFPLAPAGPDLYNGRYSPFPWIESFRANGGCNYTDAMAASVFDLSSPYAGELGVDGLNTWQYLETNMCPGKKVTHFEGWGIEPGTTPPPTVREQVDWYASHALPSGISSATTLIIPNCPPKYIPSPPYDWWYYIDGRVFTKEGTEINPDSCEMEEMSLCGYTDPSSKIKDPEYHSLRPYPHCPYDPSIRNTSYYLCGHDLIAKEKILLNSPAETPESEETLKNCYPAEAADGTIICEYYLTNRHIEVGVDLSNTVLPIVGLTDSQFIPGSESSIKPDDVLKTETNEVDGGYAVSYASRMNEYVSWYLNGSAVGRAEDNYPRIYFEDRAWQLVDYSGPLRKTLPWRIQVKQRNQVIESANPIGNPTGTITTREPYYPLDEKPDRHNQIVACVTNTSLGGLPIPCYNQDLGDFYSAYADNLLNEANRLARENDYSGAILILVDLFRDLGGSATDLMIILVQNISGFIKDKLCGPLPGLLESGCKTAIDTGTFPLLFQIIGADFAINWIVDNIVIPAVRELAPQELVGLFIDLSQAVEDLLNSTNISASGLTTKLRLSNWQDLGSASSCKSLKTPPVPEDFDSYSEYWKCFKDWRGEICTPTLFGFYACADDPTNMTKEDWFNALYHYIPFTSTEDMVGYAELDLSQTTQPASQVQNTTAVFVPDEETNAINGKTHYLYFPHMEESDELGKLAQSTYLPYVERPYWLGNTLYDLKTQGIYDTSRCEIVESRAPNPGDDLYGELEKEYESEGLQNDLYLGGTLKYSGQFTCTFIPTPDEACVLECADDPTCISTCTVTYNKCEINAAAAISLYDATPNAENVWSRFVNGSMSIFRRFYPKVGKNTPVEKIEDIPAESWASHYSDTPNVEVLAGDPSKNRPGSQARIYFPHLGSVYDYFLKGIQTALRPKDTSIPSGQGIDTDNENLMECYDEAQRQHYVAVTDLSILHPKLRTALNSAANAYELPICALEAILTSEGSKVRFPLLELGDNETKKAELREAFATALTSEWYHNDPMDVFNIQFNLDYEVPELSKTAAEFLYDAAYCTPNEANAAGPFQIVNSEWDRYSTAAKDNGFYGTRHIPNRCNFADAAYTAAAKNKEQILCDIYEMCGPISSQDTTALCLIGYTYYGWCKMDAPSCRLGTNYCDYIRAYCGAPGECKDEELIPDQWKDL